MALSGNYEILAICTDKNTFFNDLDYTADPGQHFHKSEKSTRQRHRHKIIKTNLKTLVSPLLTHPQGYQGCQKNWKDLRLFTLVPFCTNIQPKVKKLQNIFKINKNHQNMFFWDFSNFVQF